MITAVDTNVLIDIFTADKKYGRASAEALRRSIKDGAVYACDAGGGSIHANGIE